MNKKEGFYNHYQPEAEKIIFSLHRKQIEQLKEARLDESSSLNRPSLNQPFSSFVESFENKLEFNWVSILVQDFYLESFVWQLISKNGMRNYAILTYDNKLIFSPLNEFSEELLISQDLLIFKMINKPHQHAWKIISFDKLDFHLILSLSKNNENNSSYKIVEINIRCYHQIKRTNSLDLISQYKKFLVMNKLVKNTTEKTLVVELHRNIKTELLFDLFPTSKYRSLVISCKKTNLPFMVNELYVDFGFSIQKMKNQNMFKPKKDELFLTTVSKALFKQIREILLSSLFNFDTFNSLQTWAQFEFYNTNFSKNVYLLSFDNWKIMVSFWDDKLYNSICFFLLVYLHQYIQYDDEKRILLVEKLDKKQFFNLIQVKYHSRQLQKIQFVQQFVQNSLKLDDNLEYPYLETKRKKCELYNRLHRIPFNFFPNLIKDYQKQFILQPQSKRQNFLIPLVLAIFQTAFDKDTEIENFFLKNKTKEIQKLLFWLLDVFLPNQKIVFPYQIIKTTSRWFIIINEQTLTLYWNNQEKEK